MVITRKFVSVSLLMFMFSAQAGATERGSLHYGLFYPSGVDVVGFSLEREIGNGFYRYYTFGFPSAAAIGFNYYSSYDGNGITGAVGIGLGTILHAALAYQFHLNGNGFAKIGAGYTSNIVYNGLFPVLSYEQRF